MIRVVLPHHLRTLAQQSAQAQQSALAHAEREVVLQVDGVVTQSSVIDALEARYPMLRGTVRDQSTRQRRAFIRFFACGRDLSHESPDVPLPDEVMQGAEPLLIVGAMAGG